MRPPSPAGTSALKARTEHTAVRSRGEDAGLAPAPETGSVPTAEMPRGRDGVNDTDAAAAAEGARVRYRKVFACSAGDSPNEEHS